MGIVVVNHLSLDGVMQSPGRLDEDRRDGFRHGGWATSADDPAIGVAMSRELGSGFSWLFGRFSYEDMLGHWNAVGGPFRDGLNGATKYVVSSDPRYELPWPNSELLTGDVIGQIARLRAQTEHNLVVMGSGRLVRSLLPHGLVDRMVLFVHPVVLGSGRGLFGPGEVPVAFELSDSTATRDGVLVLTYRATR